MKCPSPLIQALSSNMVTNPLPPLPDQPPMPTTPLLAPTTPGADQPDFPLLPASRGFCLSLDKALGQFEVVLASLAPAEGQLELD